MNTARVRSGALLGARIGRRTTGWSAQGAKIRPMRQKDGGGMPEQIAERCNEANPDTDRDQARPVVREALERTTGGTPCRP